MCFWLQESVLGEGQQIDVTSLPSHLLYHIQHVELLTGPRGNTSKVCIIILSDYWSFDHTNPVCLFLTISRQHLCCCCNHSSSCFPRLVPAVTQFERTFVCQRGPSCHPQSGEGGSVYNLCCSLLWHLIETDVMLTLSSPLDSPWVTKGFLWQNA